MSVTVSSEGASQFLPRRQPEDSSDIQWNAEQRNIVIRDMTITFTSAQYRLLFALRSGQPVPYAVLAWMAYNCIIDAKVRAMMDKHIDGIREKLRGAGVYVYCVLNYGYVLLNEIAQEEG